MNTTKSKDELLNEIKKASYTCNVKSLTIENEVLPVLTYFNSLLISNKLSASSASTTTTTSSLSYLLFYNDTEIINEFRKLLLQSMTSQGSASHDDLRLLSFGIFASLLENSATTTNDGGENDEWFIVDEDNKNGSTFSAMLSFTVGELRITLGHSLSSNKDKTQQQRQISIIWYCTRIILCIMNQLIQLVVDIEDDESITTTKATRWNNLSMDAIFGIKKLLDDAHDSMFQYLAECSNIENGNDTTIAILCIKCMGAWLSETSIDEVTTSRSIVYQAICNSIPICTNRSTFSDNDHDTGCDDWDNNKRTNSSILITLSSEPFQYMLPALVHLSSQEKEDISMKNRIKSNVKQFLSHEKSKKEKILLDYLTYEFPTMTLMPYLNRIVEFISKIENGHDDDNNEEYFCLLQSLNWVFLLLRKLKKYYKSYNYDNIHDTIIYSVKMLYSKLQLMIQCERPSKNSVIIHANALRYAIQSWYIFHPRHHPQEDNIIISLQLIQKILVNNIPIDENDKKLLVRNLIMDYKKYRDLSLQYQSWYELDLFIVQFESFVYTNVRP